MLYCGLYLLWLQKYHGKNVIEPLFIIEHVFLGESFNSLGKGFAGKLEVSYNARSKLHNKRSITERWRIQWKLTCSIWNRHFPTSKTALAFRFLAAMQSCNCNIRTLHLEKKLLCESLQVKSLCVPGAFYPFSVALYF